MTSTTTTPTATAAGGDGIKWGVTPDAARQIIDQIPDAGEIEVYGFDLNRRVRGWLGSRKPLGCDDVAAILVHDADTGATHTIDLRAILGLRAPGVA